MYLYFKLKAFFNLSLKPSIYFLVLFILSNRFTSHLRLISWYSDISCMNSLSVSPQHSSFGFKLEKNMCNTILTRENTCLAYFTVILLIYNDWILCQKSLIYRFNQCVSEKYHIIKDPKKWGQGQKNSDPPYFRQ